MVNLNRKRNKTGKNMKKEKDRHREKLERSGEHTVEVSERKRFKRRCENRNVEENKKSGNLGQ
jgi:hypothetical protein